MKSPAEPVLNNIKNSRCSSEKVAKPYPHLVPRRRAVEAVASRCGLRQLRVGHGVDVLGPNSIENFLARASV